MKRLGVFLIMAALIAGMAGCGRTPQCNLTISSTEGGEVIEPGEGTSAYDEGTVVDLVAEADEGYQFVNWTGDVSAIADANAAATNITMNGNYSITANFALGNLEIRDWYDLDAIRDNLGGSYILMNDLDSTTAGYEELASSAGNGGKGWAPIGTQIDLFTWSFDGQGYGIRDLYINRLDETYIGLFGLIDEGWQIEEIGVANVTVLGQDYVGGLVGGNYLGIVSNCYATGIVYGGDHVGGLVGFSYEGTVSNSYYTGSVTGNSCVGGLVGDNWGGTVSNSYSIDSVTGHNRVGGLVGQSYDGTISNSYSTGSVTGIEDVGGLVGWHADIVRNSYSSCNVTGGEDVGGLVGDNYIPSTISNSYSTGSVTGNSSVGGLVGDNNHGTVGNSYSTGNVTGTSNVGGLVGENSQASVSNSYSTGSVSGNSSVGGLVGRTHLSTVSNSFWDTQTSGQNISAGGMGKNTTEMQDILTFSGAGWSITAVALNETNLAYIWNIVNNVTYPFLSWQP